MRKIAFILLISTICLSAQTKYLIFFKDKGAVKKNVLSKASPLYKEALSKLSQRSIERRERVMGKNIITYADIPLDNQYLNQIKNLGIKPVNKLRWFNAISAYLSSEQLKEVSNLSFVSNVRKVKIYNVSNPLEKLYKANNTNASLDSLYGNSYTEYNLSNIPQAYAKGIDGKGVIIGILDDGFIWKSQQCLANNKVLAEYNFVFHDTSTAPQPGDSYDSGQHGTFVFSLIGGYEPGKIIGPAHGASYILAKTEDDRSESHIEEDNYASALQWMESMGVDMTTSSLGYNIFDDTTYSYTYSDLNGNSTIVTKAADLAFQRGVLVFNAAGNEGDNSWKYVDAPADGFNVIAVGAVDENNIRASFSSIGPTYDGRIKPDVVAMGVGNYGTDESLGSNGFSYGDGTSFATPIAAGIGAMLLSVHPGISNVQARNIILQSSENSLNPNNEIGYGLISAVNVLSYPEIDSTQNGYKINKIFFSTTGVVPSSVKIHYSGKSNNISQSMSYDGKLMYSSKLDSTAQDTHVSFYFTYSDSSGGTHTEPGSSYVYSVNYGSELVKLNTATSINGPSPNVPSEYLLTQNYPNPFNPSTLINYNLPVNSFVSLKIYDVLGRLVTTLVNGTKAAGDYDVKFNGSSFASGVYLYRLVARNLKTGMEFISARKMILLK